MPCAPRSRARAGPVQSAPTLPGAGHLVSRLTATPPTADPAVVPPETPARSSCGLSIQNGSWKCSPSAKMSGNDSILLRSLTFRRRWSGQKLRPKLWKRSVSRTSTTRDLRTARFVEVYEQWASRQISRAHAAGLLGISESTFRRYVARYREQGPKGLEDRRATSPRRAPDEEVATLVGLYAERYRGWPVRRFYRAYRDSHGGTRSYTWVKNRLHESGLVTPRRSTRSTPDGGRRQPAEGRLLHQASCAYQWLPKQTWQLVALVDDASDRFHSGLFVESETIRCRFRTIYETIVAKGLFDAIHVDPALRNRHDCRETGRFADAMRELLISVIPSCGPKARSRYRRSFRILREALPQQLADAGIESASEANEFLPSFWEKFNQFVAIEPARSKAAFDPLGPTLKPKTAVILGVRPPRRSHAE